MGTPGKVFILLAFLASVMPPAISQLRMHSPYDHDRIHPEQTGFVLHESGTAEFSWTSEWTQMTAQACTDEVAIFIWHFKDGTRAYSRQGEFISDFGKHSGYLLTQKSGHLEDVHHNRIQPLTQSNYPVKVELWAGEAGKDKGFVPKAVVDYVCFDAAAIEYNQPYHFANCPDGEGK